MNKAHVVVIGAGFAGLSIARHLKKSNVNITILDENNHHTFQPLLYQVATGGLEPGSIAYPIRRIFRRQRNISFRLAKVFSVASNEKYIETSIGKIEFDFLILATGSTNNFFAFEDIKTRFFALKSITDALDMRSFLMQNLETALTVLKSEQSRYINVCIVGGGPAGLELAGALSEMKRFVLPKDFPELDFSKMTISLYEAAPKLLPSMSEKSSASSLKFLKEMGVEVHLNAKVIAYDGQNVSIENSNDFEAETVIWTAGVKGNIIDGFNNKQIVSGNRLSVDEYNRVDGLDNVFAIGDVAANISDANPKGLPMLAPVAMQHGETLAKNIMRVLNGKEMLAFEYKDKGSMATIGRNRAVVDLPKFKFQGRFAWFVWMFIHLLSLVGFRNKLVTLVDWTNNYFNYDRPLGLIIRKYKRKI